MRPPLQLSRRLPFGIIAPVIESFIGLKTLNKLYQQYDIDEEQRSSSRNILNLLNITYTVKTGSYEQIPAEGPLIIVANHPFGGVEGLILIDMILKVRKDVKILANQLLKLIKGLDEFFIGVDILKKNTYHKKNWQAFNQASTWVQNGGVLILFPSGEVASWQWSYKKVMEAPWQKTIARLIQSTKATVLPVFFEGNNSPVFHLLGLIHERIRTLWLARELINKRGRKIFLHIGKTVNMPELAMANRKGTIVNYLCLHTLLLGYKNQQITEQYRHFNNTHTKKTVNRLAEKTTIYQEINRLDRAFLLFEKNQFQAWCAPADKIPVTLNEIGCLREITFRAAGEGSGKAIDIDKFDQYYQHLFLWNQKKQEVVGAYRIGHTDQILKEKGIAAIYSHTLFDYTKLFIDSLNHPALEMGRSFIRQEYHQNPSALFFLWRGICAYLVKNPRYKVLFGPVSISSSYNELSRQLIVEFLMANHYDHKLAAHVNPVTPYKPDHKVPWTKQQLTDIYQTDLLSSLVRIIEKDKGIPILVKHYLKLKGKFAGFNIDKDFNNTLDGLIVVDLSTTDHRILGKYMGAKNVTTYFEDVQSS
ncbi:MAG: GNAT family N-acetyltransferase [Endozoicomonadaceae bacterium]|nr:GNAT family N-acetyltransferase [Endozoicomonadaceae bacterium]